jgi:hypothetical protein
MTHEPFDSRFDIDCTGLEPWEVLQALFNNTQPIGMGKRVPQVPMTQRMAAELISELRLQVDPRLDYVMGRPMKIGIIEPEDGERWWVSRVNLYNRDSMRSAADVIAELKQKNGIP